MNIPKIDVINYFSLFSPSVNLHEIPPMLLCR